MNKILKVALFLAVPVTLGAVFYNFVINDQKAEIETEAVDQTEMETAKTDEVEVASEKKEEVAEQTEKAEEKIEPKAENAETKEEQKAEESKKTEVVAEKKVSSDVLNSEPVASKKNGKSIITFRDGSVIAEGDIRDDLDNLPEQISSKMSLTEIKAFLAWKKAYDKVMTDVAEKSDIVKSKEVKDLIAKRKTTAAGFMLTEEKAKALMTFDALKKHYDKIWQENFEGTKEFSLIAITTNDKALAEQVRMAKDGDALRQKLKENASKVKSMDMDSRPQASLPPEISEAALKQGANTFVGPFEIKGSQMIFYVKDIKDAKKKEFTEEFAEEYKKVAIKDFIKTYSQTLYKKYKVQVFNADGKGVDAFATVDQKKKEIDQKQFVKLSKLKDDTVLAKTTQGNVVVADLKEFYKVSSLVDEVFISMAQQFNLSPEDVITYAVRLVIDDKILAAEVVELKYDSREDIKKKLKDVESMELKHAYFKENVKVKSEDIKRAYDKFIKSIPEEDKNDNEISVKLAFFSTQEEAAKALKSISEGEEKFGTIYKTKSDKKEAIDLGYVKKRGVAPELWALLKTGASGACCQQVVQVNSEQFGVGGKNFVIVYVADRRPVTLPSLSNESEKKYFRRLAERNKAVELTKTHLIANIRTVEGKPIEEIDRNAPEQLDRIISVLLGYAG